MENKKPEISIDFTDQFEMLEDLQKKSLEENIKEREENNRVTALNMAIHITQPENALSSVSVDDVLENANKFLNFINGKQ